VETSADEELGGHALEQTAAAVSRLTPSGTFTARSAGTTAASAIGPECAVIGDAIADHEAGDAVAQRLHHAGRLQSQHRRHLHRVETRAMIGVDEVQAHRLVADQNLARPWGGDGQIDGLEHVGTAGLGRLDRQHRISPDWS
jgi:hypothetical protein